LASRLHLSVLMLVALGSAVHAGEELPGPIPAKIVSVYDGDTITVRAHIWLGQAVETKVRLDGIDTPEINGKCDAEKTLALQARDYEAMYSRRPAASLNLFLPS
jgi:micrococcal nuclease